jgi:hypothetical protein
VPHLFLADLEKVAPVKDNLTADDDSRWIGNETHDGERAHTLAAGALSNEAYVFSSIDIIRKTVHCLQFPVPGKERGS